MWLLIALSFSLAHFFCHILQNYRRTWTWTRESSFYISISRMLFLKNKFCENCLSIAIVHCQKYWLRFFFQETRQSKWNIDIFTFAFWTHVSHGKTYFSVLLIAGEMLICCFSLVCNFSLSYIKRSYLWRKQQMSVTWATNSHTETVKQLFHELFLCCAFPRPKILMQLTVYVIIFQRVDIDITIFYVF